MDSLVRQVLATMAETAARVARCERETAAALQLTQRILEGR